MSSGRYKSNALFTQDAPIQHQTINGCLSNSIPLHNWALLYPTSYCVDFELSFNSEGRFVSLFPFYPRVRYFTTKKVIGLKKVKSK